VNEFLWNPPTKIDTVSIDGILLRAGDRVRICPKGSADATDLAMAGRTAIIESIEIDAEDQANLAVVVEDDPGKDHTPGHRFFYRVNEVEPLEGE
jgi:hypothetical protein